MTNAVLREADKRPHFSQVTSGGRVRDLDSFDDFGEVPGVFPSDLDCLFQAITVDAISATEWHWDKDWKIGPRSIHSSMWYYIAKGHGKGWSGRSTNSFSYQPGSLILLAPDVQHVIEPAPGKKSHVFTVHFHARVFGAIHLLNLLGMPPICNSTRSNSFHSASARLTREFALKKPGWRIVMEGEIRSVLFQAIRNCTQSLRPDIKLSSLAEMPRLLPVFRHIEDNLQKPELSVGDMASKAYLSEVQFRNIFRKITGDTPLRYVQRRRIECACEMLNTSTASVTCIAEVCGFSDAPFFHRVFKRRTGFTPREYRSTRYRPLATEISAVEASQAKNTLTTPTASPSLYLHQPASVGLL